jgi:integrase
MLPVFVVKILLKHHTQQEMQRREAGSVWIERDLVFTNTSGNYVNESSLLRTFKQLLEKCGLPRMRFHDLRHSAATILFNVSSG